MTQINEKSKLIATELPLGIHPVHFYILNLIYTNMIDKFKNNAKLIHHDKYDYSLVEYINNKTKIKIICKEHGVFEQSPSHHLNGVNCPICNLSKGEIEIINYLKVNNTTYISQKRFKDCKYKKTLPFDFYLPNKNICIEYDGEQHYQIKEHWGGEKEFKTIQIKDNIKTKYCKDNNIKLIRISYYEINEIQKILTKNI